MGHGRGRGSAGGYGPKKIENHCIGVRASLRYCGAISTLQSRCPLGVRSGKGHHSPSPLYGSVGYAPRKFFKKSTLKSRIFGILES